MSSLPSPSGPVTQPGFAYSDVRSLQRIDTDERGVHAVAQQFESLFIGMMLKGMRDANAAFAEGNPLSSPELTMHREMLDQQWAIHMAESGGIGLAPIIERQLRGPAEPSDPGATGMLPLPDHRRPANAGYGSAGQTLIAQPLGGRAPAFASREAFVTQVLPEIERAVEGLGISPQAVLAQSALETGWGRRVIQQPDGESSHNLFGIKAGADWDGERVEVKTLEVIDGRPQIESAQFRSYPNVRAAVQDYVELLRSDERYRDVLESSDGVSFADALQRSGYATDPQYASKIKAVLGSLGDAAGT